MLVKNNRFEIYFWQQILTPHMSELAQCLAQNGHKVTYVAQRLMSESRARQGWETPKITGVDIHLCPDRTSVETLVRSAPKDSIHLCGGIRSNGIVKLAQIKLKKRNIRQFVMMEAVDDSGIEGYIKKTLYRILFLKWKNHLDGILSTGWQTQKWIIERGMPTHKIFPFAYFLPHAPHPIGPSNQSDRLIEFIFVGQFIERKQLDLLIDALSKIKLNGGFDFKLQVIGSGPMENTLRQKGENLLGNRLKWTGRLTMDKVRHAMGTADCLVLPSRHDGWGAVVSEALMAGTPAIVSDACGSAGVVKASGMGGVFPAGNEKELRGLLQEAMNSGKVKTEQRKKLAGWAKCLGADAGADYLQQIFGFTSGNGDRPIPPWEREI